MDIISEFLTVPMIVFCLVIAFLVWVQRKAVELLFPKIKTSILWRELFLPIGPPGTGALLGMLIDQYPFPANLSNFSGRLFCGVVCGLGSGIIYRIVKKALIERLGNNSSEKSTEDSESLI